MTWRPTLAALLIALALLSGCDRDPMSERGFSLPKGDAVAGKETFLYMHCNECHTVDGETLPVIDGSEPYVELGGPVTAVKTYGQLVTAIINPSHKLADGYPEELVSEDGVSKMYYYNQHMTVQELIDLVAFLQPHYEVVAPPYTYPMYP